MSSATDRLRDWEAAAQFNASYCLKALRTICCWYILALPASTFGLLVARVRALLRVGSPPLAMRLFGLWPTGNTRVWDHRFDWTPQHLTAAQLRPLLYSYDELATEALDRLDRLETPGAASRPSACPHKPGPPQGDVLALVERHAEGDEVLGRLWKEVMTVPDWVDWEQIARGQQVVYQFKGQIILGVRPPSPLLLPSLHHGR